MPDPKRIDQLPDADPLAGSEYVPLYQGSTKRGLLSAVKAFVLANLTLAWGSVTGKPNLVVLDGAGKLPAVDGSQLTNLPGGTSAFPFTGPVYSPSSGGTPRQGTQSDFVTLLSGSAPTLTGTNFTGIPESGVTNLTADLATKASLASPALTGTPTVPTATAGTNTTQAASTAFVTTAVASKPVPTVASTANVLKGDGAGNAVAATQTGTGSAVLSTSPALVTPDIGAATGTSLNLSGNVSIGGTATLTGNVTGSGAITLASGGVSGRNVSIGYFNANSLNFGTTAGFVSWGSIGLQYSDANTLEINTGTGSMGTFRDLKLRSLIVASGTNAKRGTFTLSSGSATVSNTSITASSVIVVTVKTVSGTRAGIPDCVPTVGTGFAATGGASDNGTYNYVVIE